MADKDLKELHSEAMTVVLTNIAKYAEGSPGSAILTNLADTFEKLASHPQRSSSSRKAGGF